MQCACSILSSVACPAVQYFSTLSHTRHDFRKSIIEHKMCVSNSSTNYVRNIFHSKKKWARYDRKFISVFSRSTGYYCQIVTKLWISRHIFEKYSNIKFHENPSSGSRVVPCGRTDMTKLIIALRNIANAPETNHKFSTHF